MLVIANGQKNVIQGQYRQRDGRFLSENLRQLGLRECGLRCGVPPRQTQTDNDASGSPQRVKKRPDRGLHRGRPGKAARLKCDVHDMYDG